MFPRARERGSAMSASNHQHLFDEILINLEGAVAKFEHAIELLSSDDSGTVDLSALHRAKAAAERSATITRGATSDVRRAFD